MEIGDYNRIDSFCLSKDEKIIYAGNNNGQLLVVDVESFEILEKIEVCDGLITSVNSHPSLPYVATLGTDYSISIVKLGEDNFPTDCIHRIRMKNVTPWNDIEPIRPSKTESQPLCFHSTKRKLVSRSGNSGVLTISFNDENYEIKNCMRLDGDGHLITAKFIEDSEKILCGFPGKAFLIEHNSIIMQWKLGNFNIHWFEKVEKDIYLVANDNLTVVRLNLNVDTPEVSGPKIPIDDLEHVTYSRSNELAYIAGFDRRIYSVDPNSCQLIEKVIEMPYKLRWIKVLENDPEVMIVQSRNGALYKVNIKKKLIISEIKTNPLAIWTSCNYKNGHLIAGEGKSIVELIRENETFSSKPWRQLENKHNSFYIKRIESFGNSVAYGTTEGRLFNHSGESLELNGAIRDLQFDKSGSLLMVVTERGILYKIEYSEFKVMHNWTNDNLDRKEPFWSLAVNNHNNKYVAIAERRGDIWILNLDDFSIRDKVSSSSRPKRMKWVNENELIFVHTGSLLKYDLISNKTSIIIQGTGNTIEDFIYDLEDDHLILINYQRKLIFCELSSGQILSTVPCELDYSKGLFWIRSNNNHKLFGVHGRNGRILIYKVFNDEIYIFEILKIREFYENRSYFS